MQQPHPYLQLIDLFVYCFAEDLNTRLTHGDFEPIFLPAL
ncbi:elongation factor P hydroxylase, partial [Klebsiella pneumoniae]